MNTDPRVAELGEILALGHMRGAARKSSPKSSEPGEVSLDISGHQSGHAALEGKSKRDD